MENFINEIFIILINITDYFLNFISSVIMAFKMKNINLLLEVLMNYWIVVSVIYIINVTIIYKFFMRIINIKLEKQKQAALKKAKEEEFLKNQELARKKAQKQKEELAKEIEPAKPAKILKELEPIEHEGHVYYPTNNGLLAVAGDKNENYQDFIDKTNKEHEKDLEYQKSEFYNGKKYMEPYQPKDDDVWRFVSYAILAHWVVGDEKAENALTVFKDTFTTENNIPEMPFASVDPVPLTEMEGYEYTILANADIGIDDTDSIMEASADDDAVDFLAVTTFDDSVDSFVNDDTEETEILPDVDDTDSLFF